MAFAQGDRALLQMNEKNFDFGLRFEQLFFSIIPSTLFIVSSVWRTICQARKPAVVHAPLFQLVKLGMIVAYVAMELTLIILVASFRLNEIFLASSILKFVTAIFMLIISMVDHSRSPRPSVLLNIYLFATLILDVAQARTLFLLASGGAEHTYSRIFSASVALKVGVLLLEAKSKSRWMNWDAKSHSPEETSSIFSLGVFFWLNRMFLRGYNKILTLDDLYPLDVKLQSTMLHEKFAKNMDYSTLKGDKFGLLKVLIKTLRAHLLLPIPGRLAQLGFTICQPFFIESLLDHLRKPGASANVGYGLIGASIVIYAGIAISTALCMYPHHRMRAMTRSILVTETFTKATKARMGADDHNTALTLMSTDIERIKLGFRMIHNVWAGLIQVAVAGWMLYIRLGIVFMIPIGIVTVCFALLGVLINFTGDSQRSWMAGVQKRVGLTATVIANVKNLKISGLSSTVGDYVQQLRVDELAAGARFRKIFILAAVFGYIPMLISPPLTLAFTKTTLDTTTVFTSLSFLLLLTNPLSQIFQSVPEIVSGLACIGRIQRFLECENREDFRQFLVDREEKPSYQETDAEDASKPTLEMANSTVIIENGNFGYKADKWVLRDINTRITRCEFTMVVGPVGSGKSTFCKALLGEIPFSEGTIRLSNNFPRVGFCDQTAFLWNGTIKENIVGSSPLDENRYLEVIKATSLVSDIAGLPLGDGTNVGSEGTSLSGGQKQRVSLARALYLHSDLLVLDDIFSGLDAVTEQQVFEQVFSKNGLLKKRRCTTVLCTHSVKYLPESDHVIAFADGRLVEQGTFERLATKQGYVQGLGLHASIGRHDIPKEIISTSMITTEKELDPGICQGTMAVVAVDSTCTDQSRLVGDRTVYRHYLKSMGWMLAALCSFLAALWGFFTNFPTVWLTFWTDDVSTGYPVHSHAYYVGIYALFQVLAMGSLLLLGISLFVVSVKRAGANLHQDILRTMLRAPLAFFAKTDTGVITNLFSQDLNLIDTELPEAVMNTLFCLSQAIGQAAVMLTSSPYLAISYPFLVGTLYLIARFYLHTSKQLRLLDLEAKSPLYTHFLDTFRGIVTLRAFGFVSEDISKNAGLLDTSQRPAYLLVMIQEWLNVSLDLVVMVIAAVLTTLAVTLNSSSGFAGASLVTLMGFGESLSGIVIYFTRLETSIGAIARLKTFNETVTPEDKIDEDVFPPKSWPSEGTLELNGVSARYGTEIENKRLALHDIRLTIRPKEKVAVCGRTGSGKSSLIALLLKLLDPVPSTGANVIIDGIPLQTVDRSALREHIIAVPQEAVFLPDGTSFKTNLDPSGVSTAKECQDILQSVALWDFIQERGGMDTSMNATTLSAGQRQLLSLGRAVLRRRIRKEKQGEEGHTREGGILLLDEINSSVDLDTERVMSGIIRVEFEAYTVVAVSHRLDMVMDFNRVVVMEKGEVVEVGDPQVLASTMGTRFAKLLAARKQ